MDESVMSVAELKRHLPRQINHTTLKTILEYLEESNKIVISFKGITWIHNNSQNLNKVVSRGISN